MWKEDRQLQYITTSNNSIVVSMAHVPESSTFSTSMFSDHEEIDRLVEQKTQEMRSAANREDYLTAAKRQHEIKQLKERKASATSATTTAATDRVDSDLCLQMEQHSPFRKPAPKAKTKATSSVAHSPMKDAGPPSKKHHQATSDLTGGSEDVAGLKPPPDIKTESMVSSDNFDFGIGAANDEIDFGAVGTADDEIDNLVLDTLLGCDDEDEPVGDMQDNTDITLEDSSKLPSEFELKDVPSALWRKFPTYMPVAVFRVPGGKQLRSAKPKGLNGAECECLFGAGGYIYEHNPVYADNPDGTKVSEKLPPYEYVNTFYCTGNKRGDSTSCPYSLKVMRIEGGLVVMQRCEIKEGAKVPVGHRKKADDRHSRRSNSNKAGGLSVNQKRFIIRNYSQGERNAEWLAERMAAKGSQVKCSDAQQEHSGHFVKTINKFIEKNPRYFPTKNKYRGEILLSCFLLHFSILSSYHTSCLRFLMLCRTNAGNCPEGGT